MQGQAPEVHLSIASRFENIELVKVVLDDVLESLGVADDDRHWVELSVREAVANAIKHGNQQDPEKKVEVGVGLNEGELVISVADHGHGFDPQRVRDPLAPENRFARDGRGIFYMRKFMDAVDYSFRPDGGTVLTMRKRLGQAADASDKDRNPEEEKTT
jgi:serine/threonine-protein kinase RsbW